jgi:tetratricopeptide (TPR) repeat protein
MFNDDAYQELEAALYLEVELAKSYADKRDYDRLEQRLPELLEIARSLSDQAELGLITIESEQTLALPRKPAELLNRLVGALHEYLFISGRRNQLYTLTEQAYLAAFHTNYAGRWSDCARRASELVYLTSLLPPSIIDTMAQISFSDLQQMDLYTLSVQRQDQILPKMRAWYDHFSAANKASVNKLEVEGLVLAAFLANATGDNLKAWELYNQALQLYETHHNLVGQVQVLFALANLKANDSAEPEKAQDYYKQALEKAQESGYKYYQAECYHRLGSIAFNAGDYTSAIASLKDSLALCKRLRLKYLEAANLRELARTLEVLGDYATALVYARHALTIEETLQTWRKGATGNLIDRLEKRQLSAV